MATNAKLDFYTKVLNERHGDLKRVADELLTAMGAEDLEQKKKAATRLLERLSALMSILPQHEIPSWSSHLKGYIDRYLRSSLSGGDFLRCYSSILPQLTSHDWGLEEDENFTLDFDGVFELYRQESRLPELFDKIIELLEQIKDSGAVDSRAMVDALTKVIATMRQGKTGSYFTLNGAWAFFLSFAHNYLWAELEKLPVLGTAFEVLKKTIDEASSEILTLQENVQKELNDRVSAEVKLIHKPPFDSLMYGRGGLLLEDKSASSVAVSA